MEHVARAVVRHRKLVLVIAVLLLIPSLMGALLTGTNYDILTYLPDQLDSMKGEQSLENDFHIAATGLVTCEGMPQSDIDALADKIAAVPGVRKVISVSSLLDESVPAGMLPDELQKVAAGKNNAKLMIVLFDEAAASESTMDACKTIRTELTEQSFFGGMSMILENTRALVNKEMPWYIVCAVGASITVLFLAMGGWFVPPLFMLGLVFPIIYNFGTNVIFGEISYITKALATVLQLGVTMDFSIFLLHRYREEKAGGLQKGGGDGPGHRQHGHGDLGLQPDHDRGLPGPVHDEADPRPRHRPGDGERRGAGRAVHDHDPALAAADL
jgi:predicted RND superfamily exporter protein